MAGAPANERPEPWKSRVLTWIGIALIAILLVAPYVFVCTFLWVSAFADLFGGHMHAQEVGVYVGALFLASAPIAFLLLAYRRRQQRVVNARPVRRLRWWAACALVLGFLAPLSVSTAVGAAQAYGFPGDLHRYAAAVASGEKTGPLDLGDVASFEWDTVHILGPYSLGDEVERCLGFAWSGAPRMVDEHQQLLIFTARGKVISSKATHIYSVQFYDFTGIGRPGNCRFDRDKAVFDVTFVQSQPKSYYRLMPRRRS